MQKTIDVPENLSEITLGQYQTYVKLCDDVDNTSEFFRQKVVSIFCNIPLSSVMLIKAKDVIETVSDIMEVLGADPVHAMTFKMEGLEFGMIPDLEDMSYGEFTDLASYIGKWDTMEKAMSVLYRPIEKKVKDQYTIRGYDGTKDFCDLMRFMPLSAAMGAQVFFYNLMSDLSKHSQNYLVEEMLTEITGLQHSSDKSGEATLASTPSLTDNLKDLIML